MEFRYTHNTYFSVIRGSVTPLWTLVQETFPTKDLRDEGYFLMYNHHGNLEIVIMHPKMGKATVEEIKEFNAKQRAKAIVNIYKLKGKLSNEN